MSLPSQSLTTKEQRGTKKSWETTYGLYYTGEGNLKGESKAIRKKHGEVRGRSLCPLLCKPAALF